MAVSDLARAHREQALEPGKDAHGTKFDRNRFDEACGAQPGSFAAGMVEYWYSPVLPLLGKVCGQQVGGSPWWICHGVWLVRMHTHLSTDQHNEPGFVGVPYEGVQVKLSEEGEVMIKSPGTMVGYYKRPDLDAEAFSDDGFFRTGDKGERKPSGLLRITGRVKELFKTAKGKYVSPAPIENKLNEHPLVELSCVTGVGQPAAYAMVILAENIRKTTSDPAVRTRIEKDLAEWLDQVNRTLSGYEQLQMFVIVSDPWTIENGMLTPTMKLKRARIEAAVADKLDGWYGAKKPVLWA